MDKPISIETPKQQIDNARNRILILGITRMTVHNGPGIRTLVHFKGCPLRCAWCSTPESQNPVPELAFYPEKCAVRGLCIDACPNKAIAIKEKNIAIDRDRCDCCGDCARSCIEDAFKILGKQVSPEEIVREVKKDLLFFKNSGGGVTVSGGEPLAQMNQLWMLLQRLKTEGIGCGVDTCGFAPETELERILPYVDFFLWDIKHMDPEKHIRLTGVDNSLIVDNLRLVSRKGIPIYLRHPVIPGLNDDEWNLRQACELASELKSLVEFHLLPLHHLGKKRYASLDREYPLEGMDLIPDDEMERRKKIVESYGLKCIIGG